MLKINLVCVGNLKDKFYIDASAEYEKRLSRFCNLKITELKEFNETDNIEQIKAIEGKEIIGALKGFVILCDIKGQTLDSYELAHKIEELSTVSSEITFVIGGSYGVSEEVKKKAKFKLSISKMTFPHRLFRIMLLEQLYRAETILNGIKYHK